MNALKKIKSRPRYPWKNSSTFRKKKVKKTKQNKTNCNLDNVFGKFIASKLKVFSKNKKYVIACKISMMIFKKSPLLYQAVSCDQSESSRALALNFLPTFNWNVRVIKVCFSNKVWNMHDFVNFNLSLLWEIPCRVSFWWSRLHRRNFFV